MKRQGKGGALVAQTAGQLARMEVDIVVLLAAFCDGAAAAATTEAEAAEISLQLPHQYNNVLTSKHTSVDHHVNLRVRESPTASASTKLILGLCISLGERVYKRPRFEFNPREQFYIAHAW
ncbi:hypothetical protein PV326_001475 [Microctonus aethiopoides]|nr:hypothetical protein PV326_001475 [Microctonus aethiopoides]